MTEGSSGKLLVIVGPTASGKSALAMELASEYNGEIICADSRTVYRYMDVGTAKPSKDEMLRIKHHLVDVADPDERFTAAQFKELAVKAFEDIWQRGKLPIMVGGTGLYVDSVLFDYRFPGGEGYELRIQNKELSLEHLVAELKGLDALGAKKIDLRNRRRVERAIETVGLPRSRSLQLRPNTLVLGMSLDKKLLQKKIEQRIKLMLEKGLIDEVRKIGEKFGWENEALRAPAYLAFKDVVIDQKTVEEAAAEFAQRDLNLAKRQMTWFKRNKDIVWLDAVDPDDARAKARELVGQFLVSEQKGLG